MPNASKRPKRRIYKFTVSHDQPQCSTMRLLISHGRVAYSPYHSLVPADHVRFRKTRSDSAWICGISYDFFVRPSRSPGLQAFKKVFFTAVWKPSSPFSDPNVDFEASAFKRTAVLLGVFRSVYGEHDTRPVTLTSVGWKVMVENLISMEIVSD